AADAHRLRLVEQRLLGEAAIAAGQGAGGARDYGKVGVANLATLDRLQGPREMRHLLAAVDPVGGRGAGHVAVVPDPLDGSDRALDFVLYGRCEGGSPGGEDQLDPVRQAAP